MGQERYKEALEAWTTGMVDICHKMGRTELTVTARDRINTTALKVITDDLDEIWPDDPKGWYLGIFSLFTYNEWPFNPCDYIKVGCSIKEMVMYRAMHITPMEILGTPSKTLNNLLQTLPDDDEFKVSDRLRVNISISVTMHEIMSPALGKTAMKLAPRVPEYAELTFLEVFCTPFQNYFEEN